MKTHTAADRVLPEPISTADPGSFARSTVTDRHPAIIRQVCAENDLGAVAVGRLESLGEEMKTGVVVDPVDQWQVAPSLFEEEELGRWGRVVSRHAGLSWLDIPWYFAESFFYFKLLCAIGYYDRKSPSFHRDPYQEQKNRELHAEGGAIATAARLAQEVGKARSAGGSAEDLYRDFIMFSLWGNRIDLSNAAVTEQSRGSILDSSTYNLPVDHSGQLCALMSSASSLDVIMDNSGPELVCDLFLALVFLLAPGDRTVRLHVKNAPFYVSDAMEKDVAATISALAGDSSSSVARWGRQLEECRRQGSLVVESHWFWNGPECFDALPQALAGKLEEAEVVIVKGDANYRRLLGDRKWQCDASMESIIGCFPRPFAALRTLKSEIIVDMPQGEAESIEAEDADWLVNGKRGLIRLCK